MGNPFDVGVIRSLERTTGRHIRVFAADPAAIAQLVESVYGGGAQSVANATSGAEHTARARSTWTQHAGPGAVRQAPAPASAPAQPSGGEDGMTAAQLADEVIRRAVALGSTDIHIEPLEDVVQISYRVDGIL